MIQWNRIFNFNPKKPEGTPNSRSGFCFLFGPIVLCCLFWGWQLVYANNDQSFILATYSDLRTLDPAIAYDETSYQRILNIYEPLIFFDGAKTDTFVPILATDVPTLINKGISKDAKTYTFKIRDNVTFHEGQVLTAHDVVYSFKRHMITDPVSGPMWMLLEALTGHRSTRKDDNQIDSHVIALIDRSVEATGNQVIFHLPQPYPPFLGLLTQASSVVLSKAWAISKGCWDGNIQHVLTYNNPKPGTEPLHHQINGTGAYRLKSWEPSHQFVFERFDRYWGPQPFFKTAIVKCVKEWSTRKLMLQNSDAHRISVDAPYFESIKQMKGIRWTSVPQLSVSCAFFCQKVRFPGNTTIGSGRLDGKGIPPNFFSDIHARKAFLHLFDRKAYQQEVFNGEAIIPSTPNIDGLPYQTHVPVYEFDLDKARFHLKQAWNGQVWKNGLYMVLAHNTGNEMREVAAHMLAENLMQILPHCRVDVRAVDWKDYLVGYRNFEYPVFITGWVADFPDPHNFLYPFMHSNGNYGRLMNVSDPLINRLCDEGIQAAIPHEREQIYHKLQHLWYERAFGLILYQQVNLRVYRSNISGDIPNPMLTDAWENLKLLRMGN
ncbi:MAG: ABC transporter substrate-binding protein [Candidatus Magnetomorum sp.]|nr:ABC transporter substrate-binding protein [Candidatus Magnetomorum sp.]